MKFFIFLGKIKRQQYVQIIFKVLICLFFNLILLNNHLLNSESTIWLFRIIMLFYFIREKPK